MSESLSVKQSPTAGPGFAYIIVKEMVNGVKHKASQDGVRDQDVESVLDRLIAQAKRGL